MSMSRTGSVGYLLLVSTLIGLTACAKNEPPPVQSGVWSGDVKELRASCTALERFARELRTQPAGNDFQRFAASPDNYTFGVTEDRDSYTITFAIRPFHGRRAHDGVSVYKVDKADMNMVKVRSL